MNIIFDIIISSSNCISSFDFLEFPSKIKPFQMQCPEYRQHFNYQFTTIQLGTLINTVRRRDIRKETSGEERRTVRSRVPTTVVHVIAPKQHDGPPKTPRKQQQQLHQQHYSHYHRAATNFTRPQVGGTDPVKTPATDRNTHELQQNQQQQLGLPHRVESSTAKTLATLATGRRPCCGGVVGCHLELAGPFNPPPERPNPVPAVDSVRFLRK